MQLLAITLVSRIGISGEPGSFPELLIGVLAYHNLNDHLLTPVFSVLVKMISTMLL